MSRKKLVYVVLNDDEYKRLLSSAREHDNIPVGELAADILREYMGSQVDEIEAFAHRLRKDYTESHCQRLVKHYSGMDGSDEQLIADTLAVMFEHAFTGRAGKENDGE